MSEDCHSIEPDEPPCPFVPLPWASDKYKPQPGAECWACSLPKSAHATTRQESDHE